MLGIGFTRWLFHASEPSWERTLGWTAEQLMAVPFITFVHPDDVDETLERSKS